MQLRIATTKDLEDIRSIYNKEVTETTNTFDLRPRTRSEQRRWLKSHSGVYAAVVAEDSEAGIVGFGSLSPYKQRPGYIGTAEVSIYMHSEHRRKGAGRKLLSYLLDLATQEGFRTLIARISDSNEASHALFINADFFKVGVERQVGRKFNMWLDCAIYQKILTTG